jgi:phosphate:Na+ symporter
VTAFEAAGTFFAGLGLFFYGVKMVGSTFKEMAGRSLHRLAAQSGRYPGLAGAAGALFAGITQSVTPVTFIAVAMITGGLMEVRQALPMVIWAGVGTSLMVWLSALNVKVLALYLLGLAGTALYLNRPAGARTATAALFGIGVLFLGLQLMRSAAAQVETWPAFVAAFQGLRSSPLLVFLGGAAASLIVQSMAAVSIMAMTFGKAQVFTPDQIMLTIFGACFGSGIRVVLLAAGIRGTPRQLVLLQCLVCGIGGLGGLALFFLSGATGLSPLTAAGAALSWGVEARMAAAYLAMNLGAALLATLGLPLVRRLLERLSPPPPEEDLAKARFLHAQALSDGETALTLAVREQARLFERYPRYFEMARQPGADARLSPEAYFGANRALGRQIVAFLTGLVNRHPSPGLSDRLLARLELEKTGEALEETLRQVVGRLPGPAASPALRDFGSSMVESLDTILLTAVEAFPGADGEELAWLLRLTGDRSEMMEKVRGQYLAAESGLPQEEKVALLYLTGLFERVVWLLRQVALTLERWQRLEKK